MLKNTKEKIKNEIKGITLIALIITIVIMLILSGVMINTLSGNNGLITTILLIYSKWEKQFFYILLNQYRLKYIYKKL